LGKNSYFGVPFDYWHGLIPLITQVVLYPIAMKYWSSVSLYIVIITSLLLWTLQFVNEWTQAVDSNIVVKYGCYENFQYNSRRDTRFFVIGWMLGLFIGLVLGGIWIAI